MFWKTLFGHCIYKGQSLEIFDNYFFRWLTFGNTTIQTLIYKRNPAQFGLRYIQALTIPITLNPKRCCLLGLGGGGVLHHLAPFKIRIPITVVESNREVINCAKQFFMLARCPQVDIKHQDATFFMAHNQDPFDHIMIDLFERDHFPKQCFQKNFFELAQKNLTSAGILAINLTNINAQYPIFEWLRDLFEASTLALPISGSANMILLAGKKKPLMAMIDMLKERQQLKRFIWDKEWGQLAELSM